MRRIDWKTLRDEYVMGENAVTTTTVAKAHDVNPAAVRRRSAQEHWTDLREQYRADVSRITHQKATVKESETRVRHIFIAKELQHKALERLGTLDPNDLSPSATLAYLKEAMEMERKALGIPDELALSGAELDATLRGLLDRFAGLRQEAAGSPPDE